MPTRSQDRVCKAKINGVPMPPAPINPKMEAERKFNSNRYKISEINDGKIYGITANINVFILFAPLAFKDSTALKSKLSISSTKSFPNMPTE